MHDSRRHVQDKKCMYCHGNFGPGATPISLCDSYNFMSKCGASMRKPGKPCQRGKKSRNNSIPWPYSPNPNTITVNTKTVLLWYCCLPAGTICSQYLHISTCTPANRIYKYTRKINMQGCSNNTGCFFLSYIIII